MSYYIGFRFGWVRVFGRTVGWHDTTLYHHGRCGMQIKCWKVWTQ